MSHAQLPALALLVLSATTFASAQYAPPITCPDPHIPDATATHQVVGGSDHAIGTVITILCNPGHYIQGRSYGDKKFNVTCDQTGQWNGQQLCDPHDPDKLQKECITMHQEAAHLCDELEGHYHQFVSHKGQILLRNHCPDVRTKTIPTDDDSAKELTKKYLYLRVAQKHLGRMLAAAKKRHAESS